LIDKVGSSQLIRRFAKLSKSKPSNSGAQLAA